MGGVNKKVAPDTGYVSDVGGSVVGVVRSRRLSCGHRLHHTTHVGIIRLIKPTVLCLAEDQPRLKEAEQI